MLRRKKAHSKSKQEEKDATGNPAVRFDVSSPLSELKIPKSQRGGLEEFGSQSSCCLSRRGCCQYLTGGWLYFRLLDSVDSAEDLNERLVKEWGMVGVICALLLSLTFALFIQPETDLFKDVPPTPLALYRYVGAYTVACPTAGMVLCTLFYIYLNQVNKLMTPRFVEEFAHILVLPNMFLFSSLSMLCLQVMSIAIYVYPKASTTIISLIFICIGVMALPLTYMAVMIHRPWYGIAASHFKNKKREEQDAKQLKEHSGE